MKMLEQAKIETKSLSIQQPPEDPMAYRCVGLILEKANNNKVDLIAGCSFNIIYGCPDCEITAYDYTQMRQKTVIVPTQDDDTAGVYMYTIDRRKYTVPLPFPSDYWASSYKVQFLNFYVLEGESIAYGVRLTSEPTNTVIVTPNITLVLPHENATVLEPPIIEAYPPFHTFNSTNWNIQIRFTFTSLQNNVDHGMTTFEIVNEIQSTDVHYGSLNSKLLVVVDAADDDAAGVNLEATQALTLVEANSVFQTVTIASLSSQPIADITIVADIDSAASLNLNPSSGNITILKENWANVDQSIGFKAPSGTPAGNPQIMLRVVSDDPKFQALDRIPVTATVQTLQPGNATGYMEFNFNVETPNFKTVPNDLSVDENEEVKYEVRLAQDVPRNKNVTVSVSALSTSNAFSCSITPSVSIWIVSHYQIIKFCLTYSRLQIQQAYTFVHLGSNDLNNEDVQQFTLLTDGNLIDDDPNTIFGCAVSHTFTSEDDRYNSGAAVAFTVQCS